jgi:hypothetical protein
MAARRIVSSADFPATLRALGCLEAERMVAQLAEILAVRPHAAPSLGGSVFRVLHIGAYEELPALRLYYRFDDEALYLLDVELYDPLEPERRMGGEA